MDAPRSPKGSTARQRDKEPEIARAARQARFTNLMRQNAAPQRLAVE